MEQFLIKQETNAELGIRGNIRKFTLAGWVEEKSEYIDMLRQYVITGNKKILEFLHEQGVLLESWEKHNIIVTNGRNVLARRLANDVTYSGAINYGALGTVASPVPANADTQLGTEVYRKVCSSQTAAGNVAYVDFFYAATDTNGTYTEFGNFIDGTGTANTGRLFSRIATGGWVKSSIQSLFVSCQYTIN
jgi:hypothetical protein